MSEIIFRALFADMKKPPDIFVRWQRKICFHILRPIIDSIVSLAGINGFLICGKKQKIPATSERLRESEFIVSENPYLTRTFSLPTM